MANKRVEHDEYKINVKLRIKRNLRQRALDEKINLSQLLEKSLVNELKTIDYEKKQKND